MIRSRFGRFCSASFAFPVLFSSVHCSHHHPKEKRKTALCSLQKETHYYPFNLSLSHDQTKLPSLNQKCIHHACQWNACWTYFLLQRETLQVNLFHFLWGWDSGFLRKQLRICLVRIFSNANSFFLHSNASFFYFFSKLQSLNTSYFALCRNQWPCLVKFLGWPNNIINV